MANHPNRNWRNRWQFDKTTLTATHQTGLVVKFSNAVVPGPYGGAISGDLPESITEEAIK